MFTNSMLKCVTLLCLQLRPSVYVRHKTPQPIYILTHQCTICSNARARIMHLVAAFRLDVQLMSVDLVTMFPGSKF